MNNVNSFWRRKWKKWDGMKANHLIEHYFLKKVIEWLMEMVYVLCMRNSERLKFRSQISSTLCKCGIVFGCESYELMAMGV